MLKSTFFMLLLLVTSLVQANEQVDQTVDPELKASLAAFFAAKPSANGAVAELIAIKQWPDTKGKMHWSLPRLRHLAQRISLIAEQGKGKSLRRWYVATHVKWMRQVVTLNKDVSARTVLDRGMLTLKRKNIAGLHGKSWSKINEVEGLKTLRNMHRGDVVISTLVKRPPLIKRGDRITILVELNGIKVRAEGVALRSGSRGDRMLVQNIHSKQTLQSIVKDAHTVSVHIGGV